MMAYPTEGQKGRFVGVFWTIFNLGGVVGASVTLGQNFHSKVPFTHTVSSMTLRIFRLTLVSLSPGSPDSPVADSHVRWLTSRQ